MEQLLIRDTTQLHTQGCTPTTSLEKADLHPILMHKTIDRLVACIRAEEERSQKLSLAVSTFLASKVDACRSVADGASCTPTTLVLVTVLSSGFKYILSKLC